MKLKLILLNLAVLLSCNFFTTTVKADNNEDNLSIEEKRDNNLADKIKKINHALNNKIFTLKEHSSKISRDNYWINYVKNINYLKNNKLEIYVNKKFKKLSTKKKENIIKTIQRQSLTEVIRSIDLTTSEYMDGLSSIIYCDGIYIGRSVFLNAKEFKWID